MSVVGCVEVMPCGGEIQCDEIKAAAYHVQVGHGEVLDVAHHLYKLCVARCHVDVHEENATSLDVVSFEGWHFICGAGCSTKAHEMIIFVGV